MLIVIKAHIYIEFSFTPLLSHYDIRPREMAPDISPFQVQVLCFGFAAHNNIMNWVNYLG